MTLKAVNESSLGRISLFYTFPVDYDCGAKRSNSSTTVEKFGGLIFGYWVVHGALCHLDNHWRQPPLIKD
jgi:hypothetical protein